ncbi:MAG: glycosyltransferase family 4 protein [Muribaculaceae bacterium]|nr:glycosyltransferase family 4 protein [Muribaculaceae bacterium]
MKILYDSQIFSRQIFGGISQYFVNLINNLPSGVEGELSLRVSANHYLRNLNPPRHPLTLRHFPERAKLSALINRGGDVRRLKRGDFDLFHPTEYSTYHMGLTSRPTVITVHDMIHEYDGGKWVRESVRDEIRRSVEHADRIIAISESTKRDLVKIYGVSDDKVDVVYHGFERVAGETAVPVGLPEHYLLFVGERGGYKNFRKFFEAFALLSRNYPELHLVCTGKPFNSEERKMIAAASLEEKVVSRFVSSEEMPGLYRRAECFVFPSYYEGFGLPILEAFSAGVPVTLSGTSCFPEIAGDGGAYFDPHNAMSIAETVSRVIEDPVWKRNLIKKAELRLTDFSWCRTGEETAGVYSRTLEQAGR